MFRTAFSRATQQVGRRNYSVATAKSGNTGNAFAEARQAQKEHAGGAADLWKKISFYVAIPLVAVGYVNSNNLMAEHEAHVEHIKEENGGELPERIVYPYMNKRDKEFPWGNNTLFYNPHANIAPEGAEE
ncbi:mitochondrial cytochrome c oxidase subunit VIa [Cystobasidium minutum MCA 4210]|uniref:mitochondrial cytochrome c oxidase subunit VIa n=1 Tax=Cystobasidium minutum MCA 4210 TaxID=1397322 RepID=UPI0034CE990F|eukprot:jgi/Rhomi1/165162/fgenesh1_kg.1_\